MLSYYILTNYPYSEAASLLQGVHWLYLGLIFFGGLVSWALIYLRLRKFGYDIIRLRIFMLVAGVAGIFAIVFGSRLVRIFYEPVNKWGLDLFWEKFCAGGVFSRGTETFHASLIMLFISVFIIVYIFKSLNYINFKFYEIFDTGGLYMPLHIMFGRTGCFLSGCCWGRTGSIDVGDAIYQFNHPAPFYEMLYGLVFFLVFRSIYNKIYSSEERQRNYSGLILALSSISYGVFRFIVETVRNEPVLVWGLTQAQIAMLFLLSFGVIILIQVLYRKFNKRT